MHMYQEDHHSDTVGNLCSDLLPDEAHVHRIQQVAKTLFCRSYFNHGTLFTCGVLETSSKIAPKSHFFWHVGTCFRMITYFLICRPAEKFSRWVCIRNRLFWSKSFHRRPCIEFSNKRRWRKLSSFLVVPQFCNQLLAKCAVGFLIRVWFWRPESFSLRN